MRAGRAVVRAGTSIAVAGLALTVYNLSRLRRADLDVRPPAEPLSVLVPVRDEAEHVVSCLSAALGAADQVQAEVELLVLDDGSSDETAHLVTEIAGTDRRVRLLRGVAPPAGWLGKPWACHQLARSARSDSEVLVFLDADVVLAADGLAGTVALLRGAHLDLVSPYPRQLSGGWLERLVQPLLQWSWMSTVPLRVAERSPRSSLAVANGQLLAVDRTAYDLAGGHAAVRGEVLDDLALLRAVKSVGGHGGVVDGTDLATCRMYDSAAALREGYAKSLWSAFGSPAGAAGVVALLGLAYIVPPVAALLGSRAGLAGYLAAVTSRAVVARRTGSRVRDAVAHPLSIAALAVLTADSWRGRRRGSLRWKGRSLPGDLA